MTKAKLENSLDKVLVQLLSFLYSAPEFWVDWLVKQIRRVEDELNEPGREKSYRMLHMRMKTSILADVPRDSDGNFVDVDSVIRSLRNVNILPRNNYNRWFLPYN